MQSFLDFFYNTAINRYLLSDVVWNLFLAAIPCAISWAVYVAVRKKTWWKLPLIERVLFFPITLLWLFFLPNTVYLFAMARHLIDYCGMETYYRVCPERLWVLLFFFTYALIGLPTFIYALERMARVFSRLFGKITGRLFPPLVIPIMTIGFFLGLVRRLNSWDILHYPLYTLKDTVYFLAKPHLFWQLLLYIAVFYAIYYLFLWIFAKILAHD